MSQKHIISSVLFGFVFMILGLVHLGWETPGHAVTRLSGWTLALSWEPGFCATAPMAAECRTRNAPGLTLHGLWPEGPGTAACETRGRGAGHDWCGLPEVELSTATRALLDKAMPGTAACLDRHEWLGHGACSGMPPDVYFRAAATLAAKAQGLAVTHLVIARRGQTVTMAELRAAVAKDMGADGWDAVRAICVRRDGQAHLTELRWRLTDDGVHLFPQADALAPMRERHPGSCPADEPLMVDG
jgi:ribonuclease T2